MSNIKKEKSTIFTNKKALHNYHILEDYETGIVLSGYEVKSARLHNVSLTDSLIRITKGEAFSENAYIAPYGQISTHIQDYNAKRLRKLLLHKKEIIKLASKVKEKGLTIVPLELYVSKYGKIKLSIGLAKGKTTYDKKEILKKKDIEKETRKILKQF